MSEKLNNVANDIPKQTALNRESTVRVRFGDQR
jgi:hypothetical protein